MPFMGYIVIEMITHWGRGEQKQFLKSQYYVIAYSF